AQNPPKKEMGDLAFAIFAYAKLLHKAPAVIASNLKVELEKKPNLKGEIILAGPYLNIRYDISDLARGIYKEIKENGSNFGKSKVYDKKKMMVEFSCPNTNKPLHLGHMRNDSIGQSISEILRFASADVEKVNLINNRGVHICKSMLAYQKFGNGETPESTGIKPDHFVGNYYVKFNQWEKEDKSAGDQAQQMLQKWEEGDPNVLELWNKMNNWTLTGLAESYKNMGISFDKYYYESNTYKLGKERILKGLEDGVFYKEEDGSIWIDLEEIKLDKKVLLRKDGTALYITQDIGTAIERHNDWPFDSLIYVVASEQQYHFKVLFYVLEKLGYTWAKDLHHLSYGMVFLPNGKMKSREGTVVDADDLVENLSNLAKEEIISKNRENAVNDLDKTSSSIALSAINYYLLQVDPNRDMVFNPEESISFNGNTGPYLQYMGARISSMLSKFEEVEADYEGIEFDPSLLDSEIEREVIKNLGEFSIAVEKSALDYNPSVICNYLYDLSRNFSRFYHDNQILKAETKSLVKSRVILSKMVLQVLKNSFKLIGIPFLEKM
ncbi:MAG: arginine--tRNA ligase, partial [Sphaerochaetaceae bacterium]